MSVFSDRSHRTLDSGTRWILHQWDLAIGAAAWVGSADSGLVSRFLSAAELAVR